MAGVNKVILIGNLGKKPELRRTPSGTAVSDFSLATSKKFKDQSGQSQTKSEWHNIVCWNKTAEIAAQYLNKGSKVYIEGELETQSWDDQNGKKQYKTVIVVRELKMLDSKPQGNGGGYQQQPSYQQPQVHPENPTYTVAPQAPMQPHTPMPIDEGLDLPF